LKDIFFGVLPVDLRAHQEAIQGEAQYVLNQRMFNMVVGAGSNSVDTHQEITQVQDFTIYQNFGYLYTNLVLPERVTWTLAASYDDFKNRAVDFQYFSPKLGAQWELTNDLRLRFATFRTVKPPLIASQTLQPTEIAGFNQLYDDVNGTRSTSYVVGLDARVTEGVYLGAEAFWRDLDTPTQSRGQASTIDQNEQLYRSYLYWTPYREWAVSQGLQLDRYEGDTFGGVLPKRLQTFSAPLIVRYFSPTGFFGGVGATYINQEILPTSEDGRALSQEYENFVVLDATVGYRLPRRLGLVSLEVRNILDKRFQYQDDSFRQIGSNNPRVSPYIPARAFLAQLFVTF
jgi:TonB dependent receptor